MSMKDKADDLADRGVAMIRSECEILGFLHEHPLCVRDEFSSDEESKL